ncbi:hypothetical protein K0M31_020332, partial [Melipona bicolor]
MSTTTSTQHTRESLFIIVRVSLRGVSSRPFSPSSAGERGNVSSSSARASKKEDEQRREVTATHNFLVSVCCLHSGATSMPGVILLSIERTKPRGELSRSLLAQLVYEQRLASSEPGNSSSQPGSRASSFSLRVLSRFRLWLRHLPPVVADEASRGRENQGWAGASGYFDGSDRLCFR